MKYLSYRNYQNKSQLFVENVAISEVANAVGTPFYCYSKNCLIDNYQEFVLAMEANKISDYKICYAIKANYNIHVVSLLSSLKAGIDAVSAGEIYRALKAGINPQKIVFAGVGKTREDIEFALNNGVVEFSVESIDEMFLLNEVATKLNKTAKFSLRVNPHVDAKTHDKISTGRKGDKFGVDIDLVEEIYTIASKLPALEIYGISMHIGSQILTTEPFILAFKKMRELYFKLTKMGFKIKNLDFGGGIGINYKDDKTISVNDYIKIIRDLTKDLAVSITIAPGRAIVGNAGLLITKAIYTKQTPNKNFVIIDGAINDLMRPGLYGSYHEVLPVCKKNNSVAIFDFAGPVCESTDILAQARKINIPQANDLFAFCSAGAYGSSMSNEYNCRPLVPEIMIDDAKFSIIRRRPTFDEMMKLENL
jgi:diaminopimelate decarboxylase